MLGYKIAGRNDELLWIAMKLIECSLLDPLQNCTDIPVWLALFSVQIFFKSNHVAYTSINRRLGNFSGERFPLLNASLLLVLGVYVTIQDMMIR